MVNKLELSEWVVAIVALALFIIDDYVIASYIPAPSHMRQFLTYSTVFIALFTVATALALWVIPRLVSTRTVVRKVMLAVALAVFAFAVFSLVLTMITIMLLYMHSVFALYMRSMIHEIAIPSITPHSL